ncbi:hypothetical protein [Burkholderia sp. USMB20]|uniref:hypothetical protein n=1 Tax=Burkholderia sp. USMB20 TaxID=1571773 RepID=UPI0005DC498C|nr:hypothetical protein [Burkholderia sp. USMB20]TGN96104.1 hypothetical protein PL79_018835 [Burkholderia sp. USMB20]
MDTNRIAEYAKGWNAAQLNRALPPTGELIGAIGYRDAKSTRQRRAKAKAIPQRAEGWRFAGKAGRFHVWFPGRGDDYLVTDGEQGEVTVSSPIFGIAYACAARMDDDSRKRVEQ